MTRLLDNPRSITVAALFLLAAGASAQNLTEQYRPAADKLIDAAMTDFEGYNRLAYLCYRIGNRLSGSASLDRAVAWSAEQMKAAGLSNVRIIPTKVPHWVRGSESARLLTPLEKPLHMLGLGMSIGTPPGGITADVVAVSDFNELEKLGREKVRGKIVLYNEVYRGYGPTVIYRRSGALAGRGAGRGGGAGAQRDAAGHADSAHRRDELRRRQPKIPAAAVSPEDAMMMARLCADGVPVRVHLEMSAHMEPDADSGDVIGEIPGKEHPEEVVVMGGHLDSWDVGQGAQDDGASIIACLQAVALMKKLGLEPRRTIRVAFWVNEENGGRGGESYRAWIGDQIKNQVAAIEMDGGAETPRGFGASVDEPSFDLLRQAAKLLERDRRRRDHRRRRRRRHRAAHARRRSRPGRAHRGHALFRLAPHRSRYPRQGQPGRFPQEHGGAGGDGLRAGGHAGTANRRPADGEGCGRGARGAATVHKPHRSVPVESPYTPVAATFGPQVSPAGNGSSG